MELIARICPKCGERATRTNGGKNSKKKSGWYCAKHMRLIKARFGARRNGKFVPTLEHLESLIPKDMLCGHCGVKMCWDQNEGSYKTLITLQHDVSGKIRLICLSCNSRHAKIGDIFYEIPEDMSRCGACKKIKSDDQFMKVNNTKRHKGRWCYCKDCWKALRPRYRKKKELAL